MAPAFWAAVLSVALAAAEPAMADEAPKYGGILTFMIPADAPPSFDAHREGTFATVHSAAPFYSVLIRVDPNNPLSTTDFVCDLCAAVPQPTDSGRTYTFKIRDGVKFHDGAPLSAADVGVLAAVRGGRFHLIWNKSTRRETQMILRRIPHLDWERIAHLFQPEGEFTGP